MFTLDSIQIKKNLGIKFSWNKKVRFDKKNRFYSWTGVAYIL